MKTLNTQERISGWSCCWIESRKNKRDPVRRKIPMNHLGSDQTDIKLVRRSNRHESRLSLVRFSRRVF